MSQIETVKTCASCGADVTNQDCFQNSLGEYRCVPCYEAGKKIPNSTASPDNLKTCDWCGDRVARADCHRNRHGKYVCRKCRPIGTGRTRRRKILRWLMDEKLPVWLMYACFIAFCVWLFFNVMSRLTAPAVLE